MKKYYLKAVILILLICTGTSLFAQQDAQYTQYMYNTISINPAYAGSRGVLSVVGLHRSQWVGLPGAPRTQTLALHSPIGLGRVGLGGSVIQDELGPAEETYMNIDFSYTIPTSQDGKLSFGLKAGAHLLNVDFNKLNKFTENDTRFETNIDNKFSPNVGIGLYYHTPKYYLGLSVPNLLETNHFDETNVNVSNNASFLAEERINYYLMTGYTFTISENVLFKPALLTKLVFGTPLQVDISANFLLYEKLTLGAAYRWSAAFSGLVGFQLSDSLMVGFAYDRETTELGNTKFNDGSYELLLRFELFKKYSRIITPRFF
ncbi:PorP/SprF family type IX secretion system membrane protein [Aquimarina agarilytica]|uniref:PorP/SprF family type IX secretion system membrane protein n=1 Tax=Aquimarina agarilytica TaxID=1087449 RepID=UPI000492DE8D|nr:type IX secretion system membrane protein PorP/SprF [Aquimarina agarilytica]